MRKFNVNVNGKAYFVEIEEADASAVAAPTVAPVAAPIAAPIAAKQAAVAPAGGAIVSSPMPGLILKLNLASGATVKRGDKIVVLEAMKMENDIVASVDGVITYLAKQGDQVETGAALASIK